MATAGERRALIFLASVAALGVAVRGWREFHPTNPDELAGNRTALARQIQAVDSAIAVTSSRRKPHDARERPAPATRTAPAVDQSRVAGEGARASRSRARQPQVADTLPRDPRQAYWDRSLYFDSVRLALEAGDQARDRRNNRDSKATPSANRERASRGEAPPVDVDLAELDELAALPMVGPALARRIFDDRVENGPFGSIAELERVPGITHAFARRLERFVTFSGPPRHGSAGERRPQSKNERRPGGGSRP
jgi:hypothetical protein